MDAKLLSEKVSQRLNLSLIKQSKNNNLPFDEITLLQLAAKMRSKQTSKQPATKKKFV